MLLKQIREYVAGAPWGPKGSIKGGMSMYQKYEKLRARMNTLVQQKRKIETELGIHMGPKETLLVKRLGVITDMMQKVQDAMSSNIDLPISDEDKSISQVDFPTESMLNRISTLLTEAEEYYEK